MYNIYSTHRDGQICGATALRAGGAREARRRCERFERIKVDGENYDPRRPQAQLLQECQEPARATEASSGGAACEGGKHLIFFIV